MVSSKLSGKTDEMLGGNLVINEHPIQGRIVVVILYPLHAVETGIKSRWIGQLAQVQTVFFSFLFPCHTPCLVLSSCAELLNKGGKFLKKLWCCVSVRA